MLEKMGQKVDRRKFLTRVAGTGAALCLGGCAFTRALAQEMKDPGKKELHKFARDAGISYERIFQIAYATTFIPVMKVFAERYGMNVVEEVAGEVTRSRADKMRERFPDNSLSVLAGVFKNPSTFMSNTMTMEVVEDNESAFEMKVTECLWAKVFRDAGEGELGNCCVCKGDFITARALNPKIRLIRDKTLMEGDDCCNHRYVVVG